MVAISQQEFSPAGQEGRLELALDDAVVIDLTDAERDRWLTSALWAYERRPLRAKRALDVICAIAGLAVLSPLLTAVACAIKGTSTGPVLFRQRRVGRGGRTFTIYKFRTMRHDAEEQLDADPVKRMEFERNGFKIPLDADDRVTRLGRLLRRSSLDELPQLINVVKGDMSLVGPRPVVPDELELYGRHSAAYLAAYPGMTGNWQVTGRDDIGYPDRALLDARYVTRWSFWGDVWILIRTIGAVATAKGMKR